MSERVNSPTEVGSELSSKSISTQIHPTAIIHKGAELGEGVTIGPYSVVGENVRIGDRTSIASGCVIEGDTQIGSECQLFTGAVIGGVPQDLKYNGEPSSLEIGDRNKIREYVTMNVGTQGGGSKTIVGSDCLFMAYSHVAHDCTLGNNIILANSVALAGHIVIEDKAIIGGLCGVHQFVRVGTLSIVGGCSRVIQDIPPYATCVGMPAKVFGVNSEGLKRADVDEPSRKNLHRAFKIIFHSKLSMSHAVEQVTQEVGSGPEVKRLIDFMQASKRGVCRA